MFADTNVLVNARAVEAPHHDMAQYMLERASFDHEPIRISRQIAREYLAVVTRPQIWSDPLAPDAAIGDVNRMFSDFEVLENSSAVTEMLFALLREIPAGGRQIHDANIVTTMLAHRERRLLTFNIADFRRYGDRIELIER